MADIPIGQPDFDQLVTGIAAAESAIAQANKAISAGIDLSDIKRQAEENRDKLLKIKNVYYPGR